MIVRAEGARKFLPTIMIELWSPTIMIVRLLRIYSEQNDRIMIEYSLFSSDVHNNWTEQVENSRTQNRCTLLHRPLLSKHCHNSNTNILLHEHWIIYNMQVVTCNMQVRHFGFFDYFSINYNFCLKKFRFTKMIKLWSFPNFWKTLPTIVIELWSPTIMIVWSRQRLGWTKSGIMIDQFSGGTL